MLLKSWLEAIDYSITEGGDYGWRCYGLRAYTLDSWNGDQDGHSFSVVFDRDTQHVYEMTAYDYTNNRAYRWQDPAYKAAHIAESADHNVSSTEAWEDVEYVDLEMTEDYFEKVVAIRQGEDYDTRVKVPLTLEDDQLFELMRIAHERDITLNQLAEDLLREYISNTVAAEQGFEKLD